MNTALLLSILKPLAIGLISCMEAVLSRWRLPAGGMLQALASLFAHLHSGGFFSLPEDCY